MLDSIMMKLQPISLMFYHRNSNFRPKFILLLSKFWYSDHYNILQMPWQLYSYGMCNNFSRSDNQECNKIRINIPSNLMDKISFIVSEMGPQTV